MGELFAIRTRELFFMVEISAVALFTGSRSRLSRIIGAPLLVVVLFIGGCDQVINQVVTRQVKGMTNGELVTKTDGMRILLCGTGTPQASDAGQPCTLVSAGGRLFLFDAGENSAGNLNKFKVPFDALTTVFLTHLHSDHFNGLGALVNFSWVWGRHDELSVFGPPGTRELVDGIASAYSRDIRFRSTHMPMLDKKLGVANGYDKSIPDGQTALRVYDHDGVTIDAVKVCHEPVEPSYGYVIRYRGKKAFISGDTRICDTYASAIRGADVAIHEAYATHLVEIAIPIMKAHGQDHMANVASRTGDYHADTIELAKFAQHNGVRHLVLTHLIPAPTNVVARTLFVSGMSDHYIGKLTLGRDGMVIDL